MNKMTTAFAPAERASEEELRQQVAVFYDQEVLALILNAMPNAVVVLNQQRQTIYSNQVLLDWLGLERPADVLGARPGDLLHCQHADETPGGCGTTQFCRYCGAVNAILQAQRGEQAVQECRITQRSGSALDLRVWVTPFTVDGATFTVFALVDISDEKRRQALERIFFHDVLNIAGIVRGAAEMLPGVDRETAVELEQMIVSASNRLIDEIQAQRALVAAERGDLVLMMESVTSQALLEELASMYRDHQVAEGRTLVVAPQAEEVTFVSERHLLGRVLGNMIKNALEASAPGQTVTLTCGREREQVVFAVHNPTLMPHWVQLQMFNRSFSTKGSGRGLGTYSMKLLTEQYLHGTVRFTSSAEAGTTFFATVPLEYPEPA